MKKYALPLIGTLLCALAHAAPIDAFLDQANSYSTSLEESIVAVKAENKILDQKYAASLAQAEKFRRSLAPSIRDKASLDPIKAGFLAKKNELNDLMKVDDASVAGYRKLVANLVSDLEAIKAEYQKSGGTPDYQGFLIEKAKKRMQAFNADSYSFEKILGFLKDKGWKNHRLKAYADFEQSGAPYNRALAALIRLGEPCKDVKSITGVLPEAYVQNETNFQDPALWNFVLMGGKEVLSVDCQRNRIRRPSMSFDKEKHRLNYAWQYTLDPIGMNESRYPNENPWDLIYSEAKKRNIQASHSAGTSFGGGGDTNSDEPSSATDSVEAK